MTINKTVVEDSNCPTLRFGPQLGCDWSSRYQVGPSLPPKYLADWDAACLTHIYHSQPLTPSDSYLIHPPHCTIVTTIAAAPGSPYPLTFEKVQVVCRVLHPAFLARFVLTYSDQLICASPTLIVCAASPIYLEFLSSERICLSSVCVCALNIAPTSCRQMYETSSLCSRCYH